jgi:hypothetical protein
MPLTQAKNGDKQFWKDKFHATNECFFFFLGSWVVFWLLCNQKEGKMKGMNTMTYKKSNEV